MPVLSYKDLSLEVVCVQQQHKFPHAYQLKQHTFLIAEFLWVRNLGNSYLELLP